MALRQRAGLARSRNCGGYMRAAKFVSSLFTLAIVAAAVMPAYADTVADTRFGVAEGFRNPSVMADIGAGWERLILPWDQIQPDKPGDFGHLGQTLTKNQIQTELNRGTKVAGLLQVSPGWAAGNPDNGKRSVANNLNLPLHATNYSIGPCGLPAV